MRCPSFGLNAILSAPSSVHADEKLINASALETAAIGKKTEEPLDKSLSISI